MYLCLNVFVVFLTDCKHSSCRERICILIAIFLIFYACVYKVTEVNI